MVEWGEGLKGRDLSGLDCVLIEVTCIKWNLIGTDTGSLTDRHDADGLRGGGTGEGGRRGRGGRRRAARRSGAAETFHLPPSNVEGIFHIFFSSLKPRATSFSPPVASDTLGHLGC